jgi:hypothetical protein
VQDEQTILRKRSSQQRSSIRKIAGDHDIRRRAHSKPKAFARTAPYDHATNTRSTRSQHERGRAQLLNQSWAALAGSLHA